MVIQLFIGAFEFLTPGAALLLNVHLLLNVNLLFQLWAALLHLTRDWVGFALRWLEKGFTRTRVREWLNHAVLRAAIIKQLLLAHLECRKLVSLIRVDAQLVTYFRQQQLVLANLHTTCLVDYIWQSSRALLPTGVLSGVCLEQIAHSQVNISRILHLAQRVRLLWHECLCVCKRCGCCFRSHKMCTSVSVNITCEDTLVGCLMNGFGLCRLFNCVLHFNLLEFADAGDQELLIWAYFNQWLN